MWREAALSYYDPRDPMRFDAAVSTAEEPDTVPAALGDLGFPPGVLHEVDW